MNRNSENVIKKIAVLFTDITGSTDFFKSYGNVAGRQMLHKHESIVASTITEYGGTVVKNIGDSVMAYFFSPEETVKTAVRIQQKFKSYNKDAPPGNQIHIRIGIHFGEGIVEDDDIFGDVVNVASKLTNLADGDKILTSEEVSKSMNNLADVRFEVIDLSGRQGMPKGLTAYQVLWKDGADFEPVSAIVVCVKPIWELGIATFDKIWRTILEERGELWSDKIQQEKILSDRSVILIVSKPDAAIEISYNVLQYVRERIPKDQTPRVLPVQIVIDAGPYLGTDRLNLDSFNVRWGTISPGSIHISRKAHLIIEKENNTPFVPVPLQHTDQNQPFFEITIDESRPDKSPLLYLYQNAFLRGVHAPCFYCGSTMHDIPNCPSKNLMELTNAITKFGYLSFETINSKFLMYLGKKQSELNATLKRKESADVQDLLPHFAFYDLKRYVQLRFFKHIWDTTTNDWNKVTKAALVEGGTGGYVWLAQDCIRVSNLSQAESLLQTSLERNPKDYKVYCALGFLNLERNRGLSAEYYFEKALNNARMKPQKIFILLLLSRLYYLTDEIDKAYDKVREINYIYPHCAEAAYQDILLAFKQGRKALALERLLDLVKADRDYYVSALIDPDLAPFSTLIHPELYKIFLKVKERASRLAEAAEKGFDTFRKLLGEKDDDVKKVSVLVSDLRKLSSTDSYFGYLDVVHQSKIIRNICTTVIQRRENEFVGMLKELDVRLKKNRECAERYHFRMFSSSAHELLHPIGRRIDQIRDMVKSKRSDIFADVLRLCEEVSQELDRAEPKLRRLKRYETIVMFLSIFLRNSFVILAVILFIALVVFPNMIYYCNILLPDFILMNIDSMWMYQKQLISFGIIGGLLLSVCKSLKGMLKSS
ncbi:MAG TPA: hypothetical protein ENO00_00845 [Deltaproteobacteria bacterium]|nr:hypothetical protein [Deltaproteobacteria bacterium]